MYYALEETWQSPHTEAQTAFTEEGSSGFFQLPVWLHSPKVCTFLANIKIKLPREW